MPGHTEHGRPPPRRAATKLLYLALNPAEKKWRMLSPEGPRPRPRFAALLGGRFMKTTALTMSIRPIRYEISDTPVPMMSWSGRRRAPVANTYMMSTSNHALDQHPHGSRGADHEVRHDLTKRCSDAALPTDLIRILRYRSRKFRVLRDVNKPTIEMSFEHPAQRLYVSWVREYDPPWRSQA